MPRDRNEGLRKRCACAKDKRKDCHHPWWFGFMWNGREHRFNLVDAAEKPRGYTMPLSEARIARDTFRAKVRAGDCPCPHCVQQRVDQQPAVITPKTFGDVADRYLAKHVNVSTRTRQSAYQMQVYVRLIRESVVEVSKGTKVKIEDMPIESITKGVIDSVCADRLAAVAATLKARAEAVEAGKPAPVGRELNKGGHVGNNRLLARWRHLFNWAIVEGDVDKSPFKRADVTVVKLNRKAETPRDRRLMVRENDDEETRLLKASEPYPHVRVLIAVALETGCRIGELLKLQWRHVDRTRGTITLVNANTKTSKTRTIPMTAQVRAIVEHRRHAPDGTEHGPDAYVFGNEVGEKIGSIKKEWKAVRTVAKVTNLKFHDLRREFGSRLLEVVGGNPAIVRDWLGHADLTTTNRYLATSAVAFNAAAKLYDAARANGFAQNSHKPASEHVPPKHDARAEVSEKSVS